MNQQERNEKIELYGRGYDLLTAALADIPRQAWLFKPDPKEWSVYEVLIHLADSESNAALRARRRSALGKNLRRCGSAGLGSPPLRLGGASFARKALRPGRQRDARPRGSGHQLYY